MDKEIVLANTSRAPSDVTVVSDSKGGFTVAFSADGSTYTAQFLNNNRSVSTPVLIPGPYGKSRIQLSGEKTFWPAASRASVEAEDLDLIALKQGKFLLAMLELPTEGSPGGASAALLSAEGKPEKTVLLGSAGEYGTEIAAVVWEKNVLVAWHDGMMNASKLHLVLLNSETLDVLKHSDFQGKGPVAGPTLAMADGRPFIAWFETGNKARESVSYINTAWISRDLEFSPPKTVAEGRFIFPSPQLVSLQDGLALTFRDDADKDDTPEFYYIALNGTGGAADRQKRISQADGFKGPSLEISGDYFVSAAIRSFQRNLLIGLNRFNKQGVKQNGEFQVYADKTDFVRVDIAQGKDSLMMVYAEDKRTAGRVLAGEVSCSDRP